MAGTQPLDQGNLDLSKKVDFPGGPQFTPPKSNFSSSAMPVITKAANNAATSAQDSLKAPATPPKPVASVTLPNGNSVNPNSMYQYKLQDGSIVSYGDPSINKNALSGATFLMGPTGAETDPLSSGGTPGSPTPTPTALPSGITANAPDANGHITYSGNGVSLTAPKDQKNVSQLLGYANAIVQDNPGSNITVNPDGTATLMLQGGTKVPLSQYTLASPSAYGSAVGAATSAAQTSTANNSAAQAEIDTVNAQLEKTMQELEREQDAAMTAEGGIAGGGLGSGADAVSSVKTRYEQLKQNAKEAATAQIESIKGSLAQTNAKVSSDLSTTLSGLEQTAQNVAFSTQQQYQSQFLNTAKTFDVSTSQFPEGTNLAGLKLGANGTTGVASVDALIQQGVQAGYTPQQALALVQAGVATQNKQNQSSALTALANLSAVYGWASMTPEQIQKSSSSAAYSWAVGLVQQAFPSANTETAQQLAAAGTLASQKALLTATGSLSGVSSGLTGGQGGGPIGTIQPGTTADPNYAIPGTQGLTQSAVDRAAQIMNATGKSATAVLGSSFGGSAVAKTNALNALNNRAAQLNPNGLSVVQSEQLLKGAQTTIDTASRLKATVDSAINNVTYSAGLLLGDGTTKNPGLVAQVNFGTDVVWNEAQGKYVSKVGAGATAEKQATVGKYLQALNAITYEYGKIVYGAGTATVSSTEDAASAMNGYLSSYSQTKVINQVLGEITARQEGIQSVIDGTANQIVDGVSTDENGATILPTIVDPSTYSQPSGSSVYNGITLPN